MGQALWKLQATTYKDQKIHCSKARKSPTNCPYRIRKGLMTRLLKEPQEEPIAELKATRLSIRCSTLACCLSWSCEGETLPCKQLQGYVGVPFLGVSQFFELVDVGKGNESSLPAHRGYWRPQLSPHLRIRTDTQLIRCFELEMGPFTQNIYCIYKFIKSTMEQTKICQGIFFLSSWDKKKKKDSGFMDYNLEKEVLHLVWKSYVQYKFSLTG